MVRTLFFLLGLALALSGPAHAAEPVTVTLDVPGMNCGFCPITVRKALRKVPGVISASADLDSKTATVTYDPDRTSVEALTSATANAGYPSTLRAQP